jgi:RNA polymerase sigma factor (TIGR02999 family)
MTTMDIQTELPAHYHELKRIAQRLRSQLRPGDTLSTTVIVHEAYSRLADQPSLVVEGSAHLLAVCARAMRFVLIDQIRSKQAEKRGGGERPYSVEGLQIASLEDPGSLLALHEALQQLQAVDERLVRMIELRVFAGLSPQQIADQLDINVRTVQRDWQRAYAFLSTRLE